MDADCDAPPPRLVSPRSDPENPLQWSKRRKWLISAVSIVYGGMVSVNVSSSILSFVTLSAASDELTLGWSDRRQVSAYSFSIPSVMRELNISHELAAAGVTFFTVTFGVSSEPELEPADLAKC